MSESANSPVLPALITKRAELAEKIDTTKAELRSLIIALDNLDHTIRLFDPERGRSTAAGNLQLRAVEEGPRSVVDFRGIIHYTTADTQEPRCEVNVVLGDVSVTIAERRAPMYTLSSLAERAPSAPAPAQEVAERLQIVIPVPKSEPNLESSFVFPQTGSKDIDGRGSARKEGSIPEIK
jgi:hypothetical protein